MAEEITQETFFKALKGIDRFQGECKLSVWLCQIAKNTWFTQAEKRKRNAGPPPGDWPDPRSLEQQFADRETVLAVLILSGGTAGYLRGTEVTVAPESIERVDWADGDLTVWVQGDTYTQASSRLVTVEENGMPVTVLYFCLRSTLWNRAWASASSGGARYTLAYGNQGAPEIDRVCYYAGNFEDFQKLATADWEQGNVSAKLVWSK